MTIFYYITYRLVSVIGKLVRVETKHLVLSFFDALLRFPQFSLYLIPNNTSHAIEAKALK